MKLNGNHKRWFEAECRRQNILPDKFDLEAEWDSSLSWTENKTILTEKLAELGSPSDKETAKKYDSEAEDRFNQEVIAQEREFLEEEQKKDYERIKAMSTPELQKHYWKLERIIDTLVDGDVASMILLGPAGMGKTFTTIQHLAVRDVEFSFHNGNISALEMYHILYANREKRIVIFDDTQALLHNKSAMSILLSALYSPTGRRILEWRTTSKKLKAPPIFEFKSKIVFIANALPSDCEPLVSRCFKFNLDFTREEMLEIMLEIAKMPSGLKKAERFAIVDFIRDNSDISTKDVDLRLQKKVELVFRHNRDKWQELAKCFFEQDEMLMKMKEILASSATSKEQVKAFLEQTGYSRAQFYKLKSKLNATRHYGEGGG